MEDIQKHCDVTAVKQRKNSINDTDQPDSITDCSVNHKNCMQSTYRHCRKGTLYLIINPFGEEKFERTAGNPEKLLTIWVLYGLTADMVRTHSAATFYSRYIWGKILKEQKIWPWFGYKIAVSSMENMFLLWCRVILRLSVALYRTVNFWDIYFILYQIRNISRFYKVAKIQIHYQTLKTDSINDFALENNVTTIAR